jgi:hypothetical protein
MGFPFCFDIPKVDTTAYCMELMQFEQETLNRGIVDKALGRITGVSLISTPEAKGHNILLDAQSIQSFYDAVQGKTIKAYYTHSPSNEALDSIGLWNEFQIVEDGEYTKLTATFQALDSWKQHHQDDYDALFELAEKAPEAFGVSAEFQAETIYYDEQGEAQKFNGQEDVEVYARAVEVSAFSIVAQPAANPTGLFAEGEKLEEKQPEETSENLDEIAGTIVELQEENSKLALELKLSKDVSEAMEKSVEEHKEKIEALTKELCSMEARYKQAIADAGSEPMQATVEVKELTFEEKLANCKTWAEKNNLINQNMSDLVRNWK